MFTEPNSSSFIRFQWILHDSGVLFSESWNFYKLKKGNVVSGGNKFCRKSELFGPRFCIWILKVLSTQIFWLFVRFQCILYNSVLLFSASWNIYKLKNGNLVFGGDQFCRKSELFGTLFCITILKVLWAQIHRHWLDFNTFCIIQ